MKAGPVGSVAWGKKLREKVNDRPGRARVRKKIKTWVMCAEFLNTWYTMYDTVVARAVRTGWNDTTHVCPTPQEAVNVSFFSLTRFLYTKGAYHPACWYRGYTWNGTAFRVKENDVPALAEVERTNCNDM